MILKLITNFYTMLLKLKFFLTLFSAFDTLYTTELLGFIYLF